MNALVVGNETEKQIAFFWVCVYILRVKILKKSPNFVLNGKWLTGSWSCHHLNVNFMPLNPLFLCMCGKELLMVLDAAVMRAL